MQQSHSCSELYTAHLEIKKNKLLVEFSCAIALNIWSIAD